MSEPNDLNPYAPPKASTEGPSRRSGGRRKRGDIEDALARLDEHLSDPERVRADREAAGPRVRVVTIVFAALTVLGIVFIVAGAPSSRSPLLPIGIIVSAVFGILAIALLVLDLSLVPYGQGSTPEAALKSVFKSMSSGRFGYAWSRLSPSAREQRVRTPVLGEIAVDPGDFSMAHQDDVKGYVNSFARPGGGQMRTMAVKRMSVVDVQDDVAVIEAELAFQSWPRWVSVAMGVGFILFRPLIIVGVILYFVMRKRHEVRVTKTLLKGRDGAWYLYDADLVEEAS